MNNEVKAALVRKAIAEVLGEYIWNNNSHRKVA